MQVAKRGNLADFRTELRGKGAIRCEIRSAHIDFDGRRSAEIHDLGNDVPGFEGKLTARKFVRQELSQTLFELIHPNIGVRFQRHAQYSFMLTASPEINRVDRIVGRRRANVAQRNADVSRAGRLLNCMQNAESESFRCFHSRADGRAEPQEKLPRGNPRKDFSSKIRPEQSNHQKGTQNIRRDREPAVCRETVEDAAESVSNPMQQRRSILRFRRMLTQNPRG